MPNQKPRQPKPIRECKQVFKINDNGLDYMKAMKLTKREREVVESLVAYEFNKLQDIARRLFVHEKTVKFHLTSIYRKLRVGGKSGAVLNMTPYLYRVPTEIK